MPELPEVETVRKTLLALVLGKTIAKVEVRYDRIIQNMTSIEFVNSLAGQTFREINRYGKYLIFILDDVVLISHLRMEGKYFIKKEEEISPHEHVIFTLTSGEELRYHDTRKFGTMHLYKETDLKKIMQLDPLNKLGLEPFDNAFTVQYLKDKVKNKKTPLKLVLLDQTIICGLGNIYADEVCFMMGVNPFEAINNLDDEDFKNLIASSQQVLKKAIDLGGTTIRSFVSSLHASGLFQNELLVHTKTTCPKCHSPIIKTTLGGRGTYICSFCQRKKETKKVIAITGGIATGKSYVTSYLKKHGYPIIDCDELSKEALSEGKAPYIATIKHFKKEILKDGKIDRNLLAQIIFEDPKEKQFLEQLIHPYVLKRVGEILTELHEEMVFVEVPLLYEANLENLFDVVITTACKEEIQMMRLIEKRAYTKEKAIKRIGAQISQAEKVKSADYVIYTNQTPDDTDKQIEEVLKKLGGQNEI